MAATEDGDAPASALLNKKAGVGIMIALFAARAG